MIIRILRAVSYVSAAAMNDHYVNGVVPRRLLLVIIVTLSRFFFFFPLAYGELFVQLIIPNGKGGGSHCMGFNIFLSFMTTVLCSMTEHEVTQNICWLIYL